MVSFEDVDLCKLHKRTDTSNYTTEEKSKKEETEQFNTNTEV